MSQQVKITSSKTGIAIFVNGVYKPLPYVATDMGYTVSKLSSVFVRLQTKAGIKLDFDGKTRMYLKVPNSLNGKMLGMAGNFNFKTIDDFLTPSRDLAHSPIAFGNSWGHPNCTLVEPDYRMTACEANHQSAKYAETVCGIINSPVFESCHKAVDPKDYFTNCKEDVCGCNGDQDCICAVISAYSHACADAGKIVEGWRNSSGCGKFHQKSTFYNII